MAPPCLPIGDGELFDQRLADVLPVDIRRVEAEVLAARGEEGPRGLGGAPVLGVHGGDEGEMPVRRALKYAHLFWVTTSPWRVRLSGVLPGAISLLGGPVEQGG